MGIYLVIKNNLKRSYNNRILFILMFVLPIILIVLGSFVNQINTVSMRVGILVGNDKSINTQLFHVLDQSKGIQYSLADKNHVNTDLITGRYHFVLDFRESEGMTDFEILSYTSSLNTEIKDLLRTTFDTRVPIDLSDGQGNSMTSAQRMTAFLLTLLMITSTLNASNLIKDKSTGTLKRFCYAPTTTASYVGGNIMYNMILAICQIVFSVLFMKLFHLPYELKTSNILILGLIIISVATAYGTFISIISSSEMKANITASSITVLLAIMGGTFVPVDHMPKILKTISVVSPVRWIIEITQSMENNIGVLSHFIPYLILVSGTVLLYFITAILLKKNRLFQ